MTPMMEEVTRQPPDFSGLRKYYASPGATPERALGRLVAAWPPTVVFTSMGSSLFAAYPAQTFLLSQGIRAVAWETADLLHFHLKSLGSDTLLAVALQSGETVEIVHLLQRLPRNVPVLSVLNERESTLARGGDLLLLPMMAGLQISVCTQTYTCSVAVLMYVAFALARHPHRALSQALKQAIEEEERILERREVLTAPNAELLGYPPYAALLAHGANLSSVYQRARMFKEEVRVGREAITAAQFGYGPIEIIDPAHRYVIFARRG